MSIEFLKIFKGDTMIRILHLFLILLSLLFFSNSESKQGKEYLRVSGKSIVDSSGNKILLKGIAFGNEVWSNPSLPPEKHHSEKDFLYLKQLGFNSIRFYLNYKLFEEDSEPYKYKESGFKWIEENLHWAEKNRIYLILNMHVPQGGFQSNAETDKLWKNEEYQKRFLSLWKEIASRFKNERYLLGYSILNEPAVYGGIDTWNTFSQKTVQTIRSVDSNHIIIVERMQCALKSFGRIDWSENVNGDMNFPKIDDSNVMYEFHFYKPLQFSHQGASWIPSLKKIDIDYPGYFTDWNNVKKYADKKYLLNEIIPYVKFSQKYNVPIYLGEFGLIKGAFENGKHGTEWVSDVIDICHENGINYNYHTFHETAFGLYQNKSDNFPGELNVILADTFKKKLSVR